MKRFFHYFFGCYVLSVKGEKPLEYVNALKDEDVYFHGLKIAGENEYELKISVFSAEKAMELSSRCKRSEVKIKKKLGIPFIFSKYKKRYGIFFGAAAGAIIIYTSQFYIWDVRVNLTNDPDMSQRIISELEKVGCRPGTYIPDYNVRKAELKFLINNPEYSFVSINVIGSVANVDIRKREEKPDIIDREGMCEIVASKDGVIISADAIQGTPKVKEGDVVSKGDTLISCVTVGRYGTYRLCKAIGSVKAVTYREYETTVPYMQSVKEYTGREETKTSYEIIGKRFDLFSDEGSPFEKCDAETVKEKITLFGAIKLPLTLQKAVYREYDVKDVLISDEKARQIALDDLHMWCEREIKGDILESDITYDSDAYGVTLSCFLKVAEEIGTEKEVQPGDMILP